MSDRILPVPDGFDWTAGLPSDDMLAESAYLVSRGVRAMALAGSCPADEMSLLRALTRLRAGAQYLNGAAISFALPGLHNSEQAECGYASHPWVIEMYEWACTAGLPSGRRQQITGLLLGYSPAAIARHGEESAGERAAPEPAPASAALDRSEMSCTAAGTERAESWDHDKRPPIVAARRGCGFGKAAS